jgi:enoyl-CoA hydratase/carnithine racemase
MGSLVSYAVHERVAVVSMERPEKRNAPTLEMFAALGEAAAATAADADVGAVLLRGRQEVLSAGIDLDALGELASGDGLARVAKLQAALTRFEEADKPTIAAIEGHCYGAGAQLAAACHLRAVAPSAAISIMETRWGLLPDLGGTYRFPRLVGLGRATELAVTGRTVGQEEALRIGLAERSLDASDLEAHAVALAEELAAEAEAQAACLASADFHEAVAARRERRAPSFTGR